MERRVPTTIPRHRAVGARRVRHRCRIAPRRRREPPQRRQHLARGGRGGGGTRRDRAAVRGGTGRRRAKRVSEREWKGTLAEGGNHDLARLTDHHRAARPNRPPSREEAHQTHAGTRAHPPRSSTRASSALRASLAARFTQHARPPPDAALNTGRTASDVGGTAAAAAPGAASAAPPSAEEVEASGGSSMSPEASTPDARSCDRSSSACASRPTRATAVTATPPPPRSSAASVPAVLGTEPPAEYATRSNELIASTPPLAERVAPSSCMSRQQSPAQTALPTNVPSGSDMLEAAQLLNEARRFSSPRAHRFLGPRRPRSEVKSLSSCIMERFLENTVRRSNFAFCHHEQR